MKLDRRLNAFRPDLADARLEGQVEARLFVRGATSCVAAASAPVHREPHYNAGLDTEALCGESVTVFEVGEGWAWVQLASDGYVGYVPADRLALAGQPATHRVSALRTFVYPGASIKLPHVVPLSLGARLTVVDRRGDFAVVTGVAGLTESFVWAAHLAPLGQHAPDPVTVAEGLIGTPYLWGGKSSLGLDCSGLVQLSLDACGITAPRDSDMQEREIGVYVGPDPATAELRRGDLIFWKGHVGLMRSPTELLHANGHHLLVASEPLAEAVDRIMAKNGGPVTSIRRLAST